MEHNYVSSIGNLGEVGTKIKDLKKFQILYTNTPKYSYEMLNCESLAIQNYSKKSVLPIYTHKKSFKYDETQFIGIKIRILVINNCLNIMSR